MIEGNIAVWKDLSIPTTAPGVNLLTDSFTFSVTYKRDAVPHPPDSELPSRLFEEVKRKKEEKKESSVPLGIILTVMIVAVLVLLTAVVAGVGIHRMRAKKAAAAAKEARVKAAAAAKKARKKGDSLLSLFY